MPQEVGLKLGRLLATAVLLGAAELHAQRAAEVEDLLRIRAVSDPQLSPDGEWVAYTVETADTVRDRRDRDLWMSSWDGSRQQDPREVDQVWLLDREGGEAERITDLPGGVSELAWSPDGARLALIASAPDPADPPRGADSAERRPKPIVVDRYRFKQDESGYLSTAREHLYLLDLASRRSELVTPGEYDEAAPAWSPDGRSIAFVSRRRPEFDRDDNYDLYVVDAVPGAVPRQLTSFKGADMDPEWGQPGPILEPRRDPAGLHPGRPPGADLLRRTEAGSVAPGGRIAVLASTTAQPGEIFAVEGGDLRSISAQNEAWLAQVRLAPVEEITVRSRDGTPIHGFMVKPPGYQEGHRYPTVLRILGGPVWQYYHDFANLDWQVLAARGYLVLGVNPRGSSGRGERFARAIWAAWGQKDGEDVLAAVDWAVARKLADPGRLGVGGWSHGGILTNQLIARDRRFKAAISGAGQGNALGGYGTDQYALEYETELGRPWAGLDPWKRVSYPFLNAHRIVTPTLFVCGQEDWNVPLLNSEQMYQALSSLGVETQLVIYPGEAHDIKRPSFVRDRMQRYLEWYGRYLGNETVAGPGAGGRGERPVRGTNE